MSQEPEAARPAYRAILHPTDFSGASDLAFAHALKVALTARAKLTILHTEKTDPKSVDWTAFPGVRAMLGQWGVISADSEPAAIAAELGLSIRKLDMVQGNPIKAIERYVEDQWVDLIVLATEGREGVGRWLRGSVAEPVARRTQTPTLFLPRGAHGFVDEASGEVTLDRILVPIDHQPRPGPAIEQVGRLTRVLQTANASIYLLHVGAGTPPPFHAAPDLEAQIEVVTRDGPVVDAIVAAADDLDVNLIAMPTQGHQGFLDALRGSTTEQVLRRAGRPLLAVPVA